jgi:hypothetical protein
MRNFLRGTVVTPVWALLLLAFAPVAYADQPCARAISKASAKYVLSRAKALQKCHDGRIRGTLPAATNCETEPKAAATITNARARFDKVVAGRCGGPNGTCGNGDDLALASYGWGGVSQCPTLQASACTQAISHCGHIVSCLTCLDDEAVRQTLALSSGGLNQSSFGSGSALMTCQRMLGKGTSKFIGSVAKALSKCWEGRIKGQHGNACPVPGDGKVGQLLVKAEAKKVRTICRACGGPDRICGGSGDLAPGDIGFPASCPSVTVPAGASCAAPVSSLTGLVDCVDCVAEFDARCATAAAVPGQTAYPGECGSVGTTTTTSTTSPGPTTTTTLPTGTFLDFTTGLPGGICGNTYSDVSGTTVIKNLTCGGLSLGGGGATVPEGPTPDGSTNRFAADCSGTTCTLSAFPVGTASFDCSNTGCSFGTPLPIVNAGLSTCVDNKFSAPANGTLDTSTGEIDLDIELNATAVLTGQPSQPCPVCRIGSTSGALCAGSPGSPCTGVCEGGPDQGNPCVSTNSTGLSRDCRQPLAPGSSNRCYRGTNNGALCSSGSQCPGGTCAQQVGVIPVDLGPLTTGTTELSSPTGNFCPSQAAPGCFTNPGSSSCRLIRENGSPAGPLTFGVPASTILASTFCVGATDNGLINGAVSLPGPGATSLPGTVVLDESNTTLPTTTTTSTTTVPTTSSTLGTSTTSTSSTTSTTTSTQAAAGTVVLDFTTVQGSGACGVMQAAGAVTIRNLACGSLNLGGGHSTVPEGPIPDGATSRFLVSGCVGPNCSLDAALGGGPGVDCTASGCPFGPPLPIENGGLSTCVANSFASDASGSVNTATGAMSANVPLSTHVWITGNSTQPCPRCSAIGSPSTPANGTCDRGARAGLACMTTNSNGLSLDCIPGGTDGSSDLGLISVDLSPLLTGTASDSDPTGVFCPGQAVGTNEGCFGSTACRAFSQNGTAAGPLVLDQAQPIVLASAFCIPATGNLLIDGGASLPGPGAASLAGTVTLREIGATTTTTSTTSPTTTSTTANSTTTSSPPPTTTTTTLLPLPPLTIEFTGGTGTGDCGASRDGSGTVLMPLACGDLALGNGASGIAPSTLPDGSVNRFLLNTGDLGCILSLLTACPIGPTATEGPGFDCTTTGCFFGPPVPIPNGALSACSVSTFASPSTGTVNLLTGATTANVGLNLHLYVTGNAGQPCPQCSASGAPGAPGTGTCDRGARAGLACTSTNSQGLSKDCQPGGTDGSVDLGTIVANLSPVTTGTSSKSNPTGVFCPGQTTAGCFGDTTCRSFSETGAAPNATLSAVTPQPATLVSTFCVPSSGNVLVDGTAGLPSPAAISLQGTIRGSF